MPWEFLGFRTCLFHERQEACFFMLNQKGYFFMLKLASTVAVLAVLSVAASAQTNVQVLTSVPMGSVTVSNWYKPVSYTHLRAHETGRNLVCRLLLEKKKKKSFI